MAFPSILLALAIMSALGPGLVQTIIAVGITGIPQTNRIVRGTALRGNGETDQATPGRMGLSDGQL